MPAQSPQRSGETCDRFQRHREHRGDRASSAARAIPRCVRVELRPRPARKSAAIRAARPTAAQSEAREDAGASKMTTSCDVSIDCRRHDPSRKCIRGVRFLRRISSTDQADGSLRLTAAFHGQHAIPPHAARGKHAAAGRRRASAEQPAESILVCPGSRRQRRRDRHGGEPRCRCGRLRQWPARDSSRSNSGSPVISRHRRAHEDEATINKSPERARRRLTTPPGLRSCLSPTIRPMRARPWQFWPRRSHYFDTPGLRSRSHREMKHRIGGVRRSLLDEVPPGRARHHPRVS